MIRNYFKIAVRNILKHSFFSGITILGMTVGVTASLLIILYIQDELSYDRFHQDAALIYQVGLHGKIGGQDIRTSNTCPPMAQALVADVPEIESATRLAGYFGDAIVKKDDQSFLEEKVYFADSNFFSFFSFQLVEGDPKTALHDPNTIVLTRRMEKKYFPEGHGVGKMLTIGNDNKVFKITGIAENVPTASHVHFDFLISAASSENLQDGMWLNNFMYTYYKLKPGATMARAETRFSGIVEKYVGPQIEKFMEVSLKQMKESGGAYGYYSTALPDIHLHSTSQNDIEPGGNVVYVYLFAVIAAFIMLIACINFMNMSTARSAGRAKEVGLRKTMGSLRGQMVAQFLTESMLYSLFAVLLSVAATYGLIPLFNELSGKQLGLQSLFQLRVVFTIIAMTAFVGLVAGSYPAFYLTSFNVVEVLKGKVRAGVKSQGVRSGLVVFQFAISIFLIIATVIVFNQLNFMQERDLGFDKHHVLYLHNLDRLGTGKEAFRNSISSRSDVESASFTNNAFPGINNTTIFKSAQSEQDHIMGLYFADQEQVKVMKFSLLQGRYFSTEFPSDSTAIVLNEAAVKEFGWTDPINQELLYNGAGPTQKRYRVIGIIRDFNFESLKQKVRPLSIMYGKTNGSLAVRYTGKPTDLIADVQQQWKKLAGGEPFQYKFLDENYDELFRSEQRLSKIFSAFSGLAIFIACLGLFALAAFTAEQRTKEMGIRKAMGATVLSLVLMISKEFTWLVLIAFGLVIVPTWYAVNWWLEGFAYRTEISPWIFVLGGGAAILVAWLTVSYQSLKAASTNPVKSLRYE